MWLANYQDNVKKRKREKQPFFQGKVNNRCQPWDNPDIGSIKDYKAGITMLPKTMLCSSNGWRYGSPHGGI